MLTPAHYYVGLDLGQRADFSAFAAVQYRPGGLPHFLSPWTIPESIYELRQLQRVSLGTPYTEVVNRVARFISLPELKGNATLVVDATGLGAPVVEMIRDKEMDCTLMPVIITAGERGHLDRGYRTVPKRDLISNLEIMLERGELRTADKLPNRARLVEEMMNMKSKPTKSGNEVIGAEGKHHDDLVLAVALAAWAARKAH